MNEYISKEDAKNALLNKGQHTTRYRLGETWELNFMEILEVLDTIPSADVQSVKHGRWIEVSPKHSCCSVCDTTCLIAVYPISKGAYFCPNCGARMDGDTD